MSSVETGGLRPRGRTIAFLGAELGLLFRRRRTIAMLVALAAIPILLAVAVRITAGPSEAGRGPAFLDQITQNGLFVGFAALTVAIPLFLPLTVGVVAGDSIAGEASAGTLRYLLIAPIGRVRLLVVKFVSALVFCLVGALVVVVVGALIGLVLFPIGPVTLLSGDTIGGGDAALRALAIAAYVTVSLSGLCAVGVFISTLTDVPVGAMAATVVVSIAAQILGALPQLEAIHPWLLTAHWLGFGDLLRMPIEWGAFGENALLQLAYVAVFGALAYGRFTTRDVLA